jgi:hypothetical protein
MPSNTPPFAATLAKPAAARCISPRLRQSGDSAVTLPQVTKLLKMQGKKRRLT